MAGKNQHVTYHREEGKWAVVGEGNGKATRLVDTQAEAIAIAEPIAVNQRSELFIHRKDNSQIRERNTYGDDPFPPEG